MAHLMLLLILLWAGVTSSSPVDLHKRIIGGTTCDPNDRWYHVKLSATDGKQQTLCGGSLISNQWILTAAHCWMTGWKMYAHLQVHQGPVKVEEITEQPVIFEATDSSNNIRTHDIMLLKRSTSTTVPTVALPDCTDKPAEGVEVQIAGYGGTTTACDKWSDTLQCGNIKIGKRKIMKDVLKKDDPEFYKEVKREHWFCAETSQADTCPGDSGGGVVYKNKIYGVHAFTADTDKVCNTAVGFMDVCKYLQWIKTTTGL